jgi:holo-ACP synthase CitX
MSDAILDAREKRASLLSMMLSKGYDAVLSIRANIPGHQKNTPEAYIIVRYFEYFLREKIGFIHHERLEGEDGPYVFAAVETDEIKVLKQKLVQIEDELPLGRLVDLDVWTIEGSLSRSDLGIKPRKCYLCDRDAHFCVRNRKHALDDVLAFIKHTVKAHLIMDMQQMAKDAMMRELNLEDKFGLVTPTNSGSHHDMTYDLMIQAQDVILPYLAKLFELGGSGLEHYRLMDLGRPIGVEAENAMFEVTHGVNCYKGLIFILGLVMLSSGYILSHHHDFNHLFLTIQLLAKPLLDDFEKRPISFGEKAYHEHQIMGARGEAALGLPSVHHALRIMDQRPLTDDLLREILQLLIRSTDDTVLLKRAGSFEKYLAVKKKIALLDVHDLVAVRQFTQEAIDEKISFGGSADLLIATLFMHELQKHYF